jgi:RHS repeat-associated protein
MRRSPARGAGVCASIVTLSLVCAHAAANEHAATRPEIERSTAPGIAPAIPAGEGAGSETPLSLPVGNNETGVSSQAISVPQGTGKIQGMGESFSAQLSTGVGSFSVPFSLPAARGGVQPGLTLSYSSSGGSGNAGMGWSVGVPFIARQTDRGTPRYLDPAPGGAWTPQQDRFVFAGGQELVPICLVQGAACAGAVAGEVMPAWASGWQYFRARVEGSFLRFFWSPDHRTWRTQDRAGISIELGAPLDAPSDGNALESAPGDASAIFRWNVAREYDAQGPGDPAASATPHPVNVVVFRYVSVGGVAYLSDVYDTPPVSTAGGSSAPALASYEHHARLRYETRPDATWSYRRGWRVDQSARLVGVDVTSKSFVGGAAGSRELVRRYQLTYDPTFHASLLASVQLEGRCASVIAEDASGALPPSTACPRLPAMTFEYSHVAPYKIDGSPGARDLAGFEGFDERVRAFAASPQYSLDPGHAELFDVDADSLPDVLVTAPATQTGGHQVFFNGAGGAADAFGPSTPMAIDATLGANGLTLALGNANVASLDVDGDGTVDFFHTPASLPQAVYTPRKIGGAFTWIGRALATPSIGMQPIDFRDRRVRVADVDGDGLVDILRTNGSSTQTLFSLARYPGGDGAFGTATWTSATTATLTNQPIAFCLPWSGAPVHIGDDDVHLADMNGDGLVDLVRVRFGDVKYWPGDGRGRFGVDRYDAQGRPLACPADTFGDQRSIVMASAPELPGLDATTLRLDDVNGDGLDDLVRVRFDAIDVWLNVDGAAWTFRHVIAGTPLSTNNPRVRVVDIDGSGTRDIAWGDGRSFRYIDPLGGQRPGVLTKVSNGLGKTTELEYASSASMMLAAARAGQPWTSTMPTVMHVVSRVTERDNLAVAGRAGGVIVAEYTYRDPTYDGRQREFRGFARTTVKHVGDADADPKNGTPSDFTTTEMILGACVDDPTDASGLPSPCSFAGRWRDNPREALKGLPVVVEKYDQSGRYLSTSHAQYTFRKLYAGLDGRGVWHAYTSRTDGWLYDVASAAAVPETTLVADVAGDAARAVTLHATTGRAQVVGTTAIDAFGEVTAKASLGCIAGCTVDETITSKTTPQRIVEGSGWLYRPAETWIEGKDLVKRHWTKTTYDAHGNALSTRGVLAGTLALGRAHETAGAAVAPPPTNASMDGEIVQSAVTYDPFGNATKHVAPGGRCRDIVLDADYARLPVSEVVHAGALDSSTGCGKTLLTTIAASDRGTGAVTDVIGMNGEISHASYDGFGRTLSLTRPDPTTGALSALPSILIDYDLPLDSIARPYAIVHTRTHDGATPSSASYRDAWAIADGFGRAVVTLEQADKAAGDGGAWVVNGLTDRDAKGAPRRVFLAWFWDGADATTYPLATPPPPSAAFARTRYDGFGRVYETYHYDGQIASRTVYHALAADRYDEAALAGQHMPVTTYNDGHGRAIQQTERIRVNGNPVARSVQTRYLPSGEPWTISRVQSGMPAIVRWMAYDTLGRMVLNVDANTSVGYVGPYPSPITKALPATLKTWRYAYDDAGDLVGTSDARGCGANYFYDSAGRVLAEDYSPCRADHATYSAPDLVSGDGAEVFHRYDAIDPDVAAITAQEPSFAVDAGTYLGRTASTTDRAAKTIVRFDRRGRATGMARTIAKPGAPSVSVSARFAARWYVQTASFDAAGRIVDASTGARSPELSSGGASSVHTDYTKRGTVRKVGSSYGDLVANITRDADGLVSQLTWGDGAATTTSYAYDARRRLGSVQTYRAKAPLWSTSSATYLLPDGSTTQLLLEDGDFIYDLANNPVEIRDQRVPSEWPAGAQPVSRKMQYDDLYRLTRIDYTYSTGDDAWTSPFAAEEGGDASDPRRAKPSPRVAFDKRARWQTHAYDWLGNTQSSSDDALGFYDRSLGAITNGAAADGAYQLRSATGATSTRDGALTARYDETGNLVALAVTRSGPCLPAGAACSQRFDYGWDEVGRLVRARRWDTATPGAASDPPPLATPAAELRYAYDAGDARVLKSALDAQGSSLHTAYIFPSLELRGARFDSAANDYERTAWTEVPYLFGHGIRLGRVHYASNDLPRLQSGGTHVLLELADHLGSSSIVIDRDTGELVERGTYLAYGSVESDYRPARWGSFREDYRFTGKEEDIEVGIQYFGKRFYSPALERWLSADPLAVHAPGKADLNLYAYVHGRVLTATDPLGLDCDPKNAAPAPSQSTSKATSGAPAKLGARQSSPEPEDPRLLAAVAAQASASTSLHKNQRMTRSGEWTTTYSPQFKQLHAHWSLENDSADVYIDLLPSPHIVGESHYMGSDASDPFGNFVVGFVATGGIGATANLFKTGVNVARSLATTTAADGVESGIVAKMVTSRSPLDIARATESIGQNATVGSCTACALKNAISGATDGYQVQIARMASTGGRQGAHAVAVLTDEAGTSSYLSWGRVFPSLDAVAKEAGFKTFTSQSYDFGSYLLRITADGHWFPTAKAPIDPFF